MNYFDVREQDGVVSAKVRQSWSASPARSFPPLLRVWNCIRSGCPGAACLRWGWMHPSALSCLREKRKANRENPPLMDEIRGGFFCSVSGSEAIPRRSDNRRRAATAGRAAEARKPRGLRSKTAESRKGLPGTAQPGRAVHPMDCSAEEQNAPEEIQHQLKAPKPQGGNPILGAFVPDHCHTNAHQQVKDGPGDGKYIAGRGEGRLEQVRVNIFQPVSSKRTGKSSDSQRNGRKECKGKNTGEPLFHKNTTFGTG